MGMEGAILAVKHANATDSQDAIRDSSVLGFLYVTDVDDAKKKVKVLVPVGGRVPAGKAVVWPVSPEINREAVIG